MGIRDKNIVKAVRKSVDLFLKRAGRARNPAASAGSNDATGSDGGWTETEGITAVISETQPTPGDYEDGDIWVEVDESDNIEEIYFLIDGEWEQVPIPDPSDTVESETVFGLSPDAGASEEYSRADHTHGTPDEPDDSDEMVKVTELDTAAQYLEDKIDGQTRGSIIVSTATDYEGIQTRTLATVTETVTMLADGASVTWLRQLADLTEFLGLTQHRTKKYLAFANEVRLIVNVTAAGANTPAKIRAQYSTDQNTWYYLDGSSGPSVDISGAGLKVSDWVDLASGAKGDVFLCIVGIDGDGNADPKFGSIFLEFA